MRSKIINNNCLQFQNESLGLWSPWQQNSCNFALILVSFPMSCKYYATQYGHINTCSCVMPPDKAIYTIMSCVSYK